MGCSFEYYDFDRPPFVVGKKNGAVLAIPPLERATARLASEIAAGTTYMCVSGPSGIGRTSLARALPRLLDDSVRIAMIADPRRPWSELRPQISTQLDLGHGISRRLMAKARAGCDALVLVIDQAETITAENLEHLDVLLRYRDDDGHRLLQCVVLVDSSVCGTPLEDWVDPTWMCRIELEPISAGDLGTYLARRLVLAGWNGRLLFSGSAVNAIHHLTEGVPGAVDVLCQRVLAEADQRHGDQIGSRLVESLHLGTLEPICSVIPTPDLCAPEVLWVHCLPQPDPERLASLPVLPATVLPETLPTAAEPSRTARMQLEARPQIRMR